MSAFSFPDVFSRARLTTVEAARLLGVSRATVSSYKHGGSPHSLVVRRIERFVGAVHAALLAQELPLHQDVRREDRLKRLSAILRKHLEAAE